jgi:hypothetical protein
VEFSALAGVVQAVAAKASSMARKKRKTVEHFSMINLRRSSGSEQVSAWRKTP